MARSLGQELRDPPNPAQLADMVVHHSFDDRSKPGTDVQHSGLRRRSQSSGTERDGQGAAAAAQTGDGVGRCVSFDEAPLYLRREFIMSGYYVGERLWFMFHFVLSTSCSATSCSSRDQTRVSLPAATPYRNRLQNKAWRVASGPRRLCVLRIDPPPAGGNHLASVRRTLFGWNNETLNSWTMIAGLLLTICATVYARWGSGGSPCVLPKYWRTRREGVQLYCIHAYRRVHADASRIYGIPMRFSGQVFRCLSTHRALPQFALYDGLAAFGACGGTRAAARAIILLDAISKKDTYMFRPAGCTSRHTGNRQG